MKIAFIGLGVMGFHIAGHIAQNGHQVTVFNRTESVALAWKKQFNGSIALTPSKAARDADIIFMCVGDDSDVREVVYGELGILSSLSKEAVLVDHTTSSANLAEELADAIKPYHAYFMDAPISGGEPGAIKGNLTVMCGGEATILEKIQPVLSCYATKVELMGPHGQGQRCKMVNQICIIGVLMGLSEGLLLAEATNLNIEKVVDTLDKGAAGSWQMHHRLLSMSKNEFDFGFAIKWMQKDLRICLEEANKHGLNLLLTEDARKRYLDLIDQGLEGKEASSLICSIRQTASNYN